LRNHFGILALILISLVCGARPGVTQTITQVSTLTSATTGEVLQLQAAVVPVPGTNRFDWSYRLTNPAGNTARIDTFTVAPRANLGVLSSVRGPMGWYVAKQGGPDEKIIWRWLADSSVNPAAQLDPGETFPFEFELGQGGMVNGGEVFATGTAAFTGTSVSAGGEAQTPGAIPEPGTLSLLAVGLWPLAMWGRRRPQ
jgi:hypothetical protein